MISILFLFIYLFRVFFLFCFVLFCFFVCLFFVFVFYCSDFILFLKKRSLSSFRRNNMVKCPAPTPHTHTPMNLNFLHNLFPPNTVHSFIHFHTSFRTKSKHITVFIHDPTLFLKKMSLPYCFQFNKNLRSPKNHRRRYLNHDLPKINMS